MNIPRAPNRNFIGNVYERMKTLLAGRIYMDKPVWFKLYPLFPPIERSENKQTYENPSIERFESRKTFENPSFGRSERRGTFKNSSVGRSGSKHTFDNPIHVQNFDVSLQENDERVKKFLKKKQHLNSTVFSFEGGDLKNSRNQILKNVWNSEDFK